MHLPGQQLQICTALPKSRNCLSLWERWQRISADGEGKPLSQKILPTAYKLFTRSSLYSGSIGSRLLMTTPPLAAAPVEWI